MGLTGYSGVRWLDRQCHRSARSAPVWVAGLGAPTAQLGHVRELRVLRRDDRLGRARAL